MLTLHSSREQWPWHWGGWAANASLLIENVTALLDTLAQVPPEQVAAMQRTIAAHAHLLQYAAVDTALLRRPEGSDEKDAFDVAIENAWRLSQDEKRQRHGRELQRRAAG